jgi:hypothetical protein
MAAAATISDGRNTRPLLGGAEPTRGGLASAVSIEGKAP